MEYARRLAAARQEANRGRPSYKVDPRRSDDEVNWVGVFGEVGFCIAERVRPSRLVHRGPGLRGATRAPDAGEWEVKSTTDLGRDYIAVPAHLDHKHHRRHRYVLVLCAPPELWVGGWLYGYEFLDEQHLEHLAYCPAFVGRGLRPYVPPCFRELAGGSVGKGGAR